jgi:NOL1/NOP2/sun family putative RNA methylase
MPPLPQAFQARMADLLGPETPAFLASLEDAPAAGVRTNTLKLPAAALAALSPVPLTPLAWAPEGFWMPEAARVFFNGRNPLHAAGAYYLQEPSAMAAAGLAGVQPGERILDLAAAPGGKSTHLAARLGQRGVLIANEIHPSRVWTLAENLERCGVRNAVITQETPERLAEHFGAFFDRVLVDAPCSGEGMFRKSAEARQAWSPDLVRGCALRQGDILSQAARLVRPGGTLVYSTCTFAPEENEGVVAAFLARQAAAGRRFHLLPAPPEAGSLSPGQPDWGGVGAPAELAHAVRLWPQRQAGDGHFIARLRLEDGPLPSMPRPAPASLPRSVAQAWQTFAADSLVSLDFLASHTLSLHGSYLYALPPGLPDLDGLRFIHPGWWLGAMHKDRLEPAHALALGLAASDARRVRRLEQAEVARYLGGESLPNSEEQRGWTLAVLPTPVGLLPLGWLKASGGQLKNAYPKGLRQAG